MPTEKQKMLTGELYRADDPELDDDRDRCAQLVRQYNQEPSTEQRHRLLQRMLNTVGSRAEIMSPFACDYGYNISIGADVFVNYGTIILDCAPVAIGDATLVGPAVQMLTADHPRDPQVRRSGLQLAAPITIGVNVWLGAGSIVCPGVTIGDDSIIGAGSVVTSSIPAAVVAVGNPCRVAREL